MRARRLLVVSLAALLAGGALGGCEDDGGAPGWNGNLGAGGAITVTDAAATRDGAVADGPAGDAAADAGTPDSVGN